MAKLSLLSTCWTIEIAERILSEPVGKLISFICYWLVELVVSWNADSHLIIKFPTV